MDSEKTLSHEAKDCHLENGSCGHHHHDHGDGCSCGHEHHHDDSCGCGHQHHQDSPCDCEHHHGQKRRHHTGDSRRAVYLLKNIDCANCAAKVEQKVRELEGVEDAIVTFVTKQMQVFAKDPEALHPAIQALVADLEPDVELILLEQQNQRTPTRLYTLEGLDCANCAAKIERKLNTLAGVEEAVVTYATKQLRITAAHPDALFEKIQATVQALEPDVTVRPVERKSSDTQPEEPEPSHQLPQMVIGAGALIAGTLIERMAGTEGQLPALLVYVLGYLMLGAGVLRNAWKSIRKGHAFDENFLMSIATLGAFAIGEYAEALGVMLFYRVGEWFEDWAVSRSRSNIMEALDLRPETVHLVLGDDVVPIPAEEAQVGDTLLVRVGDYVPVDGVILSGESLIDTSTITGEPVPVRATVGDEILSGCLNTSGVLTMQVQTPLEESMVSRILNSVENAAAAKPQIDRFITRFSRIYTPFVVLAAVVVAIVPSLLTGEWQYWLRTACSFLVISCPCALVLSVPLAFFAGIGAASRQNILFKGGNAMEMLARVKTAALDKTGTITKGNFVVQEITCANQVSENALLTMAAACEEHSTHPIARSICTAAAERNLNIQAISEAQEIAGQGVVAGDLLCGSAQLLAEHGVTLPPLPDAQGCTQVFVAKAGVYQGRILISDTIKEGAAQAIRKLKALGVTPVMLTGDGEHSARTVADLVGIDQIRAKLLPQEKLAAVQSLRENGDSVLFVGDGINDTPVLAGADVGAAMGSGADAALETADVVFLGGELDAIPKAVQIARQATRISRQNVVIAIAVKVFVLLLGPLGFANMWLAVFADTGVAMICVLNSIRILWKKQWRSRQPS